ncbi:MAG: hypothetical protein ACO1QB_06870, partial [Verrucomicrobiales bacterium]
EVIEHPWSLPPNIKKHLDLNSGNQMGRIYRVVPDDFQQPTLPKLSKATSTELVQLLEHSNGWHRETAARLLYQRQDKESLPALKKLAATSTNELGRMHALYAIHGLDALSMEIVAAGLSDRSALVRRHAIQLSENFVAGVDGKALAERLGALASDDSREVRSQLASTLSKMQVELGAPILARLLEKEPSGWERTAVLASASRAPSLVKSKLIDSTSSKNQETLAELIGARNSPDEVKKFLQELKELETARSIPLASALQSGLKKRGATLLSADYKGYSAEFAPKAMELLSSESASAELKMAALRLLSDQPDFTSLAEEWLRKNQNGDNHVMTAMVRQLAAQNNPAAQKLALENWINLSTETKPEILQQMLARPANWGPILNAVQSGKIARTEFSAAQVDALRKGGDAGTRALALQIFGKGTESSRKEVVEKLLDAARLAGDASRGKAILEQRCLICHQLNGTGQALGPAFETVRSAGRESLLVNILDPNREVSPRYAAYSVETEDGESYTGILASENAKSINLLLPGGSVSEFSRDQIKSFKPTGQSLMPEQLEEGLSKQDLADLLEAISAEK